MAAKKKEAEDTAVKDEGDVESGEKVVEKKKRMVAQMDTDGQEIVKWVREGGEVVFMSDDLPRLTDELLEDLPFRVVKEYKAARKKAEAAVLSGELDIQTLSGNASNKLKLRARPGWHQTWKRPDELEDALNKGYVRIREPNPKKGKEGPGQESGPIKTIKKGQGDVELIAMEVSQERYDRHVQAMTKKSRDAYARNKMGFASSVEEVNRRVPKEDRVKIYDAEGDVG